MAMFVDETCIACAACEPECPTKAISESGDIYVIEADLCVECIGHFDSPRCVEVCPVDCIHKVE